MISFRIGYHGAQGRFGVTPDLTTLGKVIGGGLPVGAFGGRADVMALFDPRSEQALGHGGTFNANPLSMAAGLATLAELTLERYADLEKLAIELKEELERQKAPAYPSARSDHSSRSASPRSVRASTSELFLTLLGNGILLTPRGMGCLSTPMTSAEIDTFVEATRLGLVELGLA